MASRKKNDKKLIKKVEDTAAEHNATATIDDKKSPTVLQLTVQQKTSVISAFLNPVEDFIKIGFRVEAKRFNLNAHNMAASFNRLNAMTGTYPELKMDYTKVLFSKGNMSDPEDVMMLVTEMGLKFKWNTRLDADGIKWSDQVMIMAYMPERHEALYLLNGSRRTVGEELLLLPDFGVPVIIETYISFIAANHTSVSNSLYTGQVVWNGIKTL